MQRELVPQDGAACVPRQVEVRVLQGVKARADHGIFLQDDDQKTGSDSRRHQSINQLMHSGGRGKRQPINQLMRSGGSTQHRSDEH